MVAQEGQDVLPNDRGDAAADEEDEEGPEEEADGDQGRAAVGALRERRLSFDAGVRKVFSGKQRTRYLEESAQRLQLDFALR